MQPKLKLISPKPTEERDMDRCDNTSTTEDQKIPQENLGNIKKEGEKRAMGEVNVASKAEAEKSVDMLAAALGYAGRGWKVFPLRPGMKIPATSNGFYAGSCDEGTIKEWWRKFPTANIGIATGADSGIVVLDIDVKEGKDGFLSLSEITGGVYPETLQVQTPTGGRHYYFRHPGATVGSNAGKLGSGLDVRGDKGYIVAPPSVIDGRHYRWSNESAMMTEVPGWFATEKPVPPKVKAESSFATQGTRNQTIFKMASALRGKGVSFEDAEAEVLLAATACAPPLPEEEAVTALQSAYRYPEGGGPPEEIRELNEKHAVVRMGNSCRVLTEVYDPGLGVGDIVFFSTAGFKDLYGNRLLDGKKLGEAWLAHPNRRQYEGVVFAPGVEMAGYYNLWRGFPMKSKAGECNLYLDHVRDNIANGDEEVFQYLLAWMADVIQRPRELPGVAVVLRGKQGTGKGVVATEFGKLFGKHFKHLAHGKHLTGNFNNHLKDALFVFADEAFWGGKKESEGALKALITEERLTIEGKGQDQYFVKNHMHLIMASNNEWVVPASFEERRFLILDVSEKRQQDHEYFAAIREQMDNGGREALLYLLENLDLSSINLRKIPKTKALLDTKLLSMPPVQKFWYSRLQAGTVLSTDREWRTSVPLADLKKEYKEFLMDLSAKSRYSDEEFGKQLRTLIPNLDRYRPMVDGIRQGYHYRLPPLEECREYLQRIMQADITWEVDPEEPGIDF